MEMSYTYEELKEELCKRFPEGIVTMKNGKEVLRFDTFSFEMERCYENMVTDEKDVPMSLVEDVVLEHLKKENTLLDMDNMSYCLLTKDETPENAFVAGHFGEMNVCVQSVIDKDVMIARTANPIVEKYADVHNTLLKNTLDNIEIKTIKIDENDVTSRLLSARNRGMVTPIFASLINNMKWKESDMAYKMAFLPLPDDTWYVIPVFDEDDLDMSQKMVDMANVLSKTNMPMIVWNIEEKRWEMNNEEVKLEWTK